MTQTILLSYFCFIASSKLGLVMPEPLQTWVVSDFWFSLLKADGRRSMFYSLVRVRDVL
jgi:hypothetical protein